MAAIHFGRLIGDEGFSRIVAIKRLHAELAQDEQFVAMFLDEARIASRVQHRNVVPVLDVATVGQDVILVQEYVQGAPLDLLLANMRRLEQRLPVDLAVAIACQLLAGLQAVHDTVDELGQPMHIVHRDVSPQNVMIALDGSARLLDFGIATAGVQPRTSSERIYKGKLAYSAPEHLQRAATQQSDIYSASVLLWELLMGERMHGTMAGAELASAVMRGALPRMSETLSATGRWHALDESERTRLQALEPIVEKGLCFDTRDRWATAREMEEALTACVPQAPARALAEWVGTAGETFIALRARILALEEERWRRLYPNEHGRSSDPGLRTSSRGLRISNPPDNPGPRAGARVKRVRAAQLALAAGGGVALASALALLVPASPISPFGAKAPSEPPRRALERPVAPQAPAGEAPKEAAEPPRLAPLAARTRSAGLEAPVLAAQRPKDGADDNAAPTRAASPPPATTADAPADMAAALRPARAPAQQPVLPVPVPSAKKSEDCDVPYYFEGKKKIFKDACI